MSRPAPTVKMSRLKCSDSSTVVRRLMESPGAPCMSSVLRVCHLSTVRNPTGATFDSSVGRGQSRSEAESGRRRSPRRAKGVESRPSGAPSLASHAATTCSDRRFRALPSAPNAVMSGDLGDYLQASGSTVTAPTGRGRGHQARDIAAQSARRHRLPLSSHRSPPCRSGERRR